MRRIKAIVSIGSIAFVSFLVAYLVLRIIDQLSVEFPCKRFVKATTFGLDRVLLAIPRIPLLGSLVSKGTKIVASARDDPTGRFTNHINRLKDLFWPSERGRLRRPIMISDRTVIGSVNLPGTAIIWVIFFLPLALLDIFIRGDTISVFAWVFLCILTFAFSSTDFRPAGVFGGLLIVTAFHFLNTTTWFLPVVLLLILMLGESRSPSVVVCLSCETVSDFTATRCRECHRPAMHKRISAADRAAIRLRRLRCMERKVESIVSLGEPYASSKQELIQPIMKLRNELDIYSDSADMVLAKEEKEINSIRMELDDLALQNMRNQLLQTKSKLNSLIEIGFDLREERKAVVELLRMEDARELISRCQHLNQIEEVVKHFETLEEERSKIAVELRGFAQKIAQLRLAHVNVSIGRQMISSIDRLIKDVQIELARIRLEELQKWYSDTRTDLEDSTRRKLEYNKERLEKVKDSTDPAVIHPAVSTMDEVRESLAEGDLAKATELVSDLNKQVEELWRRYKKVKGFEEKIALLEQRIEFTRRYGGDTAILERLREGIEEAKHSLDHRRIISLASQLERAIQESCGKLKRVADAQRLEDNLRNLENLEAEGFDVSKLKKMASRIQDAILKDNPTAEPLAELERAIRVRIQLLGERGELRKTIEESRQEIRNIMNLYFVEKVIEENQYRAAMSSLEPKMKTLRESVSCIENEIQLLNPKKQKKKGQEMIDPICGQVVDPKTEDFVVCLFCEEKHGFKCYFHKEHWEKWVSTNRDGVIRCPKDNRELPKGVIKEFLSTPKERKGRMASDSKTTRLRPV